MCKIGTYNNGQTLTSCSPIRQALFKRKHACYICQQLLNYPWHCLPRKEPNYIKLSVDIKKNVWQEYFQTNPQHKAENTSIQVTNNRFETKLAYVFQDRILYMNRGEGGGGERNGHENLRNALPHLI